MATREYDLVLYGATGDAGRAIASHLAQAVPQSFKWAIAGRSKARLEVLRSKVLAEHPHADLGIVVATCDVTSGSLRDMAARARLVITAAGPYHVVGEPVVAACIEAGTHYVDITGEIPWVAEMSAAYNARAKAAGVCLCSFSGYDCVPAELSVFLARKEGLRGAKLQSAECVFDLGGAGGAPRGTLLTVITSMSPSFVGGMMRFLPPAERGPTCLSLLLWLLPWWSTGVGAFTIPHFMGWCNTPVVHASCAALGTGGLRYQDRQLLGGGGPLSLYGLLPVAFTYMIALALALPFAVCALALALAPPLRRALAGVLVAAGYSYHGSREAVVKLHTRATAVGGGTATVTFVCPGDAGIHCTARLSAETALAMLDAGPALPGGLTTPVLAVGDALAARLRNGGVVIKCQRVASLDFRR